jgi:cytochrome c oxidase assembly protein subunit 15
MMTSDTGVKTIRNRRQIGIWLLVCCALIFIMVVLGGVTRLTGSGLSMVQWQPVYGILPPLQQSDWEDLFEKYKKTPEYQKININMDLEGFKGIFWLEYFHRILGRLIGLVFLVPFLFFLLTGKLEGPLVSKLVIMFVLGGLQGGLGWIMVKSGLVNDPHVSQYRLTAHLMLAVLIYGYIMWVALGLLITDTGIRVGDHLATLRRFTYFLMGLVVLTIASGGFVAGLKAGLAYNTFPLMDGRLIPEGMFNLQPWYLNFFENMATVQFDHRLLAVLVFVFCLVLWFMSRGYRLTPAVNFACHLLLIVAALQLGLGISTLLLHVPVTLGAAHQAGALVVFTVVLFLAHRLHGLGVRLPQT